MAPTKAEDPVCPTTSLGTVPELIVQTKDGPPTLSEMGESIDMSTFEQILEMDDDDDRDFSKGIVYGFFDQAESTFDKMGKAL